MALDLAMLAFALSLGVGTFFSPCAVALVPAYVAYYTGTGTGTGTGAGVGTGADGGTEQAGHEAGTRSSLLAGLRFGGAAAAGVLGIFALGSLAIYVLRSRLGAVDSAGLLSTFTVAGVTVGLGLIVLGVVMLTSRSPKLQLPLSAPQRRTLPSMAAFGIVFAIASMGCTLPLFFGLIGAALAQPPLTSLAMVVAFGAAIAGLLLVVTIALALAEDRVKPLIGQASRHVETVGGLLLIAAGLYTVNFYLEIVAV